MLYAFQYRDFTFTQSRSSHGHFERWPWHYRGPWQVGPYQSAPRRSMLRQVHSGSDRATPASCSTLLTVLQFAVVVHTSQE